MDGIGQTKITATKTPVNGAERCGKCGKTVYGEMEGSPMNEPEKIVLRIQKAILVVYPAEVIELVRDSPPLLMKALQRGKHEHRAEKEQGRQGK